MSGPVGRLGDTSLPTIYQSVSFISWKVRMPLLVQVGVAGSTDGFLAVGGVRGVREVPTRSSQRRFMNKDLEDSPPRRLLV